MGGSQHVFATDNIDPFSQVSVLSKGIVGDRDHEPMVISPISKKAFSLITGQCFECKDVSINTYPVKVDGGAIKVMLNPEGFIQKTLSSTSEYRPVVLE